MKRQISLRQQIDYSEGFIHGIENNIDKRKIDFEAASKSPWFSGYTKGYFAHRRMKTETGDDFLNGTGQTNL